MSEHKVFRVDTAIPPLVSLCRVLLVPVPEAKLSNTTMAVGMLAALGAARGSAAARKVSNRVREGVNQGGEVLREMVQAVVQSVVVPGPAPSRRGRQLLAWSPCKGRLGAMK